MLWAGGINPDGMLLEDARDVVDVLVALKRAIPAEHWVDSLVAAAEESKWSSFI